MRLFPSVDSRHRRHPHEHSFEMRQRTAVVLFVLAVGCALLALIVRIVL